MHQFKVADMTCGHCVSTIEKAVKDVDPKADVSADIEEKTVTIHSIADAARISDAIRQAGYENQALAV